MGRVNLMKSQNLSQMSYGLYKYIFNYLLSQQQLQVKCGIWAVQSEHLLTAELDCEKTIVQNFPCLWHRKIVRADLSSAMLSAAVLRQVSLRKCDTRYLRRQAGPRGHESSGNSLALPPIAQAMGNGKWISQQPELQRWDQEPLISAWSFVQPSAIHMLVEKLWRGLFIQSCKFLLGLHTWFRPRPALWVTASHETGLRNCAKQQLLTYFFPIQLEA